MRNTVKLIRPVKDDKWWLGITALNVTTRAMYWQKDKSKYKCYCTNCGCYQWFTADEWAEVKASSICPQCYEEAYNLINYRKPVSRTAYVMDKYNMAGYRVDVELDFKAETLKTDTLHVMRINNKMKWEAYGIVKVMSSLGYAPQKDFWRPLRSQQADNYLSQFYINKERYNATHKEELGKYGYHERGLKFVQFKSNQLEIIKKHIVNNQQCLYIKLFDIKSMEPLLKHADYIKQYKIYTKNLHFQMNESWLDFIDKMHIGIGLFIDYLEQCETLHIKPEKNKNFRELHDHLANQITMKRRNINQEEILKRFDELKGNQMQQDNCIIKPLGSYEEIVEVASTLHNCIASNYADKYANGETDLYVGTVDDKITFALEIFRRELKQCYAAYNKPVVKELADKVKAFCIANNFEWEGKLKWQSE